MVKGTHGAINPRLARKIDNYLRPGINNSALTRKTRLICLVAGAQAACRRDILRGLIVRALDLKITIREIYEALLQGHLFCGYPKAIESFIILRETLAELNITRPRKPALPYGQKRNSLKARGLSLARRIYGRNFDLVYGNINDLSPELAEGMIAEGYGRIISRKGLDIKARELAIISTLTVADMSRQLYSHIRGAVNVGVRPAQIAEAIGLCRLYVGRDSVKRALQTFEKSLGKKPAAQ